MKATLSFQKKHSRLHIANLTLLMAFAFCTLLPSSMRAQQQMVEIGDGGTTTNSYLPSYSYYNYSLTQQIYTAAEIGTPGTIHSIAFYNGGSTKTRTYRVYLVHTSKTNFSSSTDWITVTASDLVFSGSVSMTASSWITFNLSTPFEYNGTSNLALIMDDNTGSYSSGMACRVFTPGVSNCAIRVYSDGTNYDPFAPTSYSGTRLNVKNQLRLNITPTPQCTALTSPADGATISSSSATLQWNAVNNASSYHIYLGTSPDMPANYTYSTSSTSVSYTNIPYGVQYCWVVPVVNGNESQGCEYTTFTRACPGTISAPTISADANLNNLSCGQIVTLTANGEYANYYWYSDAGCTHQVGEGANYSFTAGDSPITVYCKSACVSSLPRTVSQNFSYTGSQQTYTVPSGVTSVTLEAWGAQGGGSQVDNNSSLGVGGKGGYSVGTMSVSSGTTLYVSVGGQGGTSNAQSSVAAPGGWNGGGTSFASSSSDPAGGGGGATHIATASGLLKNLSGNQSAVLIVAGGGGGGGEDSEQGGYGGGTTGGTGSSSGATGGTQSSAGTGGAFGSGASTTYDGGGGGGGWYGGGTSGGSQTIPTSNSSSDANGGCGGSGYVSSTLTEAQTIGGNVSFPAPAGGTETGHGGNGYARISYVQQGNATYSAAASVTAAAAPAPATPVVEVASACPGQDVTLTVTNAVPGLTYGWWDNSSCSGSPLFEGNSYTIYNIQNSGTYYVRAYSGTMFPVYDFSYTGSAQSLTVPGGVSSVTLEVWGAQGGGQQTNGNTNAGYGGNGGYSVGTMSVSGGEILYVYVGGEGQESSALAYGGFNGGGTNYGSSSGEPACGGGGATDIRLNGNTLYDRIIVAGGGGGGGEDSGDQGGYGGGTSGGAGNAYSYQGTQTSAGTGAVFGIGASAGNDGGGGGGGWYGGGTYGGSQTIPTSGSGNDCNGGSGGSGYVWTSATSSYAPSGYRVPTSYYLSNAQTIAGNVSFPAPNGGNETGHAGNGYARVTFNDATPLCQSPICTVPVNLYQAPTFTLSASALSSCNQSPVTLTINNPSNDIIRYEWSDGYTGGGQSRVVTPGVTTTYTVTAFNNGCGTSHEVEITVNAPNVTLSGTDNGVCVEAGTEVTLTAVASNVVPTSYSGSLNMTNSTIQLHRGDMYHYYDPNGPSADYTNDQDYTQTFTSANGEPICIVFSTVGAESCCDYLYLYDGPNTSGTSLRSEATHHIYNIPTNTVYTANSGSLTIHYTSDVSNVGLGWEATIYVLGTQDFAWSNGSAESSITVTPQETTTYTVTVSGTAFDCDAVMDYTVRVLPVLEVTPENPMICAGSTINLTAATADNYTWHRNTVNGTIVGNSATYTASEGTFVVVATNDDGCSVNETVTVEELDVPSPGEISEQNVCQSDYEIILHSTSNAVGGGNVEYRWAIGSSVTTGWSTDPEYTLTSAQRETLGIGDFTMTRYFRDECGSQGQVSATLHINPPMAAPTVQGVNTLFCGQNTTLTASTSVQGNIVYRWYSDPEGQNLVYEGSEFVTPALDATTTYYVQTVDVPVVNIPYDFNYTGSVQSWPVPAGVTEVQLEVWGAQGGRGSYNTYTGGLGGYSVATLGNLNGVNSLNVYVGGAGTTSTTAGWNGGGAGVNSGGGGGGATDIRVNGNTLYDRIIVAGGGGGAGVSVGSANPAGCGGGLYGGDGYYNYTDGTSVTTNYRSGSGATQTQGGTCWTNGGSYTPSTPTTGSFGQGGNASDYSCGGGGGGWYGGGGAFDNDSDSDGRYGGGGSGYVWTAATASSAPSGYNVSASYYLTNAQTIAGNTSFPAPNGGTETGHTGNGHARITVTAMEMAVANCPSELVPFTITVNRMPAPVVEVRSACIGEPSELVVTNPVEGYQYQWSTTNEFNENDIVGTGVTFTPTVNQQTRYYVRSVAGVTTEPIDFDYTGDVQTYHIPAGVSSVLLEVWGAEGGQTYYSSSAYTWFGGRGGYASGTLSVTSGDVLSIYVGGKGGDGTTGIGSAMGGWNGGGNSGVSSNSSYFYGGAGGGATDVRLNGSSLGNRILVAGGGGGAGYGASATNTIGAGNGGGLNGETATYSNGYDTRKGTGGTQTAGGAAGTYTSGNGTAGSLGSGGVGGDGAASGGGGGAGYYGGGGGNYGSQMCGGGGGGSAYIGGVAEGVTYAGSASFLAPDGTTETGHTGNGFARITLLDMATDYCPSAVAEVVLNPQPAPSFTLEYSSNSYCAGDDAVVLTIQNPSSDITSYAWSDGTTSTDLTHVVTPGYTTTYTVTASNGACGVASDPITIAVDAPEVTLSGTDNGECVEAGTEVTLTADGPSMIPTSYSGSLNMTNSTIQLHRGDMYHFYDPNGPSSDYTNDQDYTQTFTSANGEPICIVFSNVGAESCCDYLYLYDGPNTSGTSLRTGTSYIYNIPTNTVYTANSGSLTIHYTSDVSNVGLGWEATIYVLGRPTFAWSNGSTESSITVAPDATTTYTVTVTDVDYECPAILDYTVRVTPTVEIAPENPMICPNGDITLTASGADTYFWNTGEHTAVNTVGDGTYSVMGTNNDGCSANATITVNELAAPSAGEIANMNVCQSDYEITLASNAPAVGGGNVEYRWTISSITTDWSENLVTYTLSDQERETLGTNTYNVTREYRDECGNSSSATGTLTINPPMAAPLVTGNTEVACGSTTTLTAAGYEGNDYIYRWYADPACTQRLGEGATFTTPAINSDTTFYVQVEHISVVTETHPFNYTGGEQVLEIPSDATTAELHVYGAQGGSGCSSSPSYYPGGLGGYMSGTVDLTGISQLYVNVGGQGESALMQMASYPALQGGYNGGGNTGIHDNTSYYNQGGAGGGATHIATRSGVLSSLEAHQSDVLIVAGGGGGAGGQDSYAGNGGGLSGTAASSSTDYYGQGGSQSSGGSGATGTYPAASGSFGQGGNGGSNSGVTGGAGGGGGWYGGGGGRSGNSFSCYGGGGGSGYFSPMLTETNAMAGTRSGNGYAEIILTRYNRLSCPTEAIPVHLTKVEPENPTVEVSACVGLPAALTVTNPIDGYDYIWSTDPEGNNIVGTGITFSPTLDGPATYYVRGAVTQQSVVDYSYTGSVQTYTVPAGVSQVQLEVWGAQGGDATNGGMGGYSVGTLNVGSGDVLNVYVGGQGAIGLSGGGYNGGGNPTNESYYGGGGATDIRINGSTLYHRVIAAGGGGGYRSSGYTPGVGGGNSGTDAVASSYPGYAGTQTEGGYSGGNDYGSGYVTNGSFGLGGTMITTVNGFAGGGGGWYGGGSGHAGGGGSGYVYTSSTASNYPSGCQLNSSYYLTDAQTIAGNQNFLAPDGTTETGHAGNGFARITVTQVAATTPCTTEAVEVSVTPYPSPSVELSASSTEACNQEEVELTFTASSDVLSYQFSSGVEERDGHYYVQPGITTTYTVSVSNEGCTITDEVTIHVAAPDVQLTVSDPTLCLENGAELTLEVLTGGGTSISQSAAGYEFSARTETFQSFSDGTSCSVSDDISTANVPIGFTFNYCGTDYTTIQNVNSNGVLQFGYSGASNGNYLSSNTSSYYNAIAPFWDDLVPSTYQYKTTGTAPNRVFELQFYGYRYSYSDYYFYHQVKLYEGSNIIEFCYGPSGFSSVGSSANASIGINSYVNGQFSFLSVTPTAAGAATTSTVTANDNVPGSSYLQNSVYRFTPQPPLTMYWSTGDETTSITVNPTEDQTYTVTVSSAGYNCDAVLSYDVHVVPVVSVTAVPEFICENEEAVLTAMGADTYEWTSGNQGATVTLGEGVYMVTGTTEAGCSATSSYVVQVPTFTAGAIQSDEITICASQTIPVNIASLTDGVSGGNAAYRWRCNGQLIDGSDMSSYTVSVAEMTEHNGGDFTYTREYLNGCTGNWETSAGSYIIHQTAAVSLTVAGNTQVECGTGTTLTASGYEGDNVTYRWYADENCTQPIHTGATFNVGNVTEDVTYYVRAFTGVDEELVQTFSYTGSEQTYEIPVGVTEVLLEVWGAQGGSASTSYPGGKGGYSVGTLPVSYGDVLHIYVGGQGGGSLTSNTSVSSDGYVAGGFNGGGQSYQTSSSYIRGSGGGGTDIRLNSTSLYSRVIVAGGGGGSYYYTSSTGLGAYGGGLSGGSGAGSGGTQDSGGTGNYQSGGFGTGAGHSGTSWLSGGGGGWYGGANGNPGAGGSGYVYTASTASNYPSGCLLNSSYYLTDAQTIAGNQSFPAPAGGMETGHSGNGYARLTLTVSQQEGCASLVTPVTITKLAPVAPVVTASSTEVVCGTTTTMTVQNPNDELLYQWSTDPTFGTILHTGTEYTPVVGGEVTYYVRSIPQNIVIEPQDFSYTGAAQTYTVPDGITEVLLEVWGAQGGDCIGSSSSVTEFGGKGGYSVGTMPVSAGDVLHVYVGGQGTSNIHDGMGNGGFNGGGYGYSGYSGGSSYTAGSGGGATDIRLNNTSLYARAIVAGGGGGTSNGGSTSGRLAGVGGGNEGGTALITPAYSGEYIYATGGTATSGGTYGYCGNGSSYASASFNGSFGEGGSPVGGSSYAFAGGGGGWYGGGASAWGPGGGGSGYVYTASTASNYPSGCLLNSSYYLTDAQTIAGSESFLAPDGTTEIGHSGNGFARITPLGTATSNCISANASITITTTEPEPVEIEDVTVGCGAPATLTISNAVPGLYYDWYADAACTQLVHQGTSWTLPEVGSNTTYYIRSYGLNQVPGTVMMDSVIPYSGSSFEFMVPPAVSEVTLQLWGAQGGNVNYGANQSITQYGGKGGYAAGTLAVDEGDVLYFNVGGQGGNGTSGVTNAAIPGGFNGGGNGGAATSSGSDYYPGAGGGGATDVRLGSNNISDRILVAGGGGGAAYHATASSITGGFGGGAAGTDGYTYISGRNGKGATASTSGAAGTDASYANGMAGTTNVNGGVGGNGGTGASGGAGGGGGYHGGGGGAAGNYQSGAAGGGSGYCSSVLTHTANIAGNVRMPSPTGGYTTGRTGDGIAIISYIRPVFDTLCITTPTAVNVSIEPLPTPSVQDQTVVCGTPAMLAVANANSSYTYIWYADANCTQEVNRGVTFELDGSSNISADTVYYVKAYRGLLAASQEGSQGFAYNNDVQVFEIPANATRLTMEVWGADGGNRDEAYGDTLGGIGGYSVGTLNNLEGLDALYVYVGGRGNGSNGGFNGGQSASASAGGGGGGASDVSFAQAAVNSTEHYNSRLIVAGGGGGSGFMNANRKVAGGYGGGLAGGQGESGTTGQATVAGGNGGSQTSAGHNDGQNNMIGAFGTANTAVSMYGGGGGGGWYGGASGAGENIYGGGGGGSGFVWNSGSIDYVPASYTVGSAYYLINAYTLAGNEPTLPAKPVDTHNGYVMIHYYFPEIYLCESQPAAVHVRTTTIGGPEYASASDAEENEVEQICNGDNIYLIAYTTPADGDSEEPMVLWFDDEDNYVGASNSGEMLQVTPDQYGSVGYHYYYAYAATDLISMSGSSSLHTTAPVTGNVSDRDNIGKGVFVDVTANANLTVDSISFYPGYTSSAQAKVYYRRGSCAATSTNSQGWNLAYSGEVYQTAGVACNIPFSVPVNVASGETFAFYVVSDNDMYYRPYGINANNTAGIHFGDVLNEYSTSAMTIHANYGTADNVAEFSTQHGNYHFIGDIHYTLTGEVQFGCVSDDSYPVEVEVVSGPSVDNMVIQAEDSIICAGQSVQLTAVGGSQGDDAEYVWTAGSCDGTVFSHGREGTYSVVTVSPDTTTTYYVKFESPVCGATECVAKTIYVLNPAEVAHIATPEPICAVGALNINAPSFSTDLEQLGVAVDARGWECSEDGENFVEFTDSLAIGESYNGWFVRYYVTTRCATGYSDTVMLTVDSLPVVAHLNEPAPMCSPTTFDWDSYIPTVDPHNNSDADVVTEWHVMIDGEVVAFDPAREFSYGHDVKAWYSVQNGCGTVNSDTMTLVFWQAPYADNITALNGAVCAGQQLAVLPPVTHEYGGNIEQGWEYTRTFASELYYRFPSDTIIDYGMNHTYVRYYIGNECGMMTTNSVELVVNDIPTLGELTYAGSTYCSGDVFDLETPEVLATGDIQSLGAGWYLSADSALNSDNTLTSVDVTAGVDADHWNGQWLRYADTNACGVGFSNAVQIAVYPSHHLVVTPEFDTTCFGPAHTITAQSDYPDASFSWDGDGLNETTGAQVTISPADPGDWTYTVTATEPTHGCTATASASFHLNLISKDTTIHICASDLNYVFDEVGHPEIVCTQSGFFTYEYVTASGCDSVVYLNLDVTYPIERTTRIHYCNYPVMPYVWPVSGESLINESMADTVIYRTQVVPCANNTSDLNGHICDSIVYSLELTISNEPYLDIPVTNVVMPVNQTATAEFNVRKDCDFPGVKMAVAFNLYKDDTLIDVMSDYGTVSMATYMPEVDRQFGREVRIGTGELPGNTFSLYNYDFNYFYADYFCSLNNYVTASWNQPGEYKLQLVVIGMDGGMDYAYTDDHQQVMGGAGSYFNDRVYADTSYIYFHVGAVDTMPVTDTMVCDGDLPFYVYGVEVTGAGYYEAFAGNEGNYQMYPYNVTVNTVHYEEFTVTLNDDCDSYVWNGQTCTRLGDYYDTVRYASGCDSLITTLHLRHGSEDNVVIDTNVMSCGAFVWAVNGETYNVSGDYTAVGTVGDCTATYNMHLTVNTPYDTTINVTVAPMQLPYAYDDEHVYDAAGLYDIVYQSANGCDSIIHINLTEGTTGFVFDSITIPADLGTTGQFDVNVTGGGLDNMKVAIDYEITRNGEILENVADYGYVYFSTDYADIHQTIGRELRTGTGSIPQNSFRVIYYQYTYWYLNFLDYTTNHLTARWDLPGEYKIKFYLRGREGGEDYSLTFDQNNPQLVGGGGSTTIAGDLAVDSLVMHYNIDTVFMTLDTTICSNEVPFVYHGHEFTASTTEPQEIEFADPYLVSDTVVTFSLTVNPAYDLYDTAYICKGDSYQDANFTLTADTIALKTRRINGEDKAVFTLDTTTVAGCDSTVTLTLYVLPLPNFHISSPATSVCAGADFDIAAVGNADRYVWTGDQLQQAVNNNQNNEITAETVHVTVDETMTVYLTGYIDSLINPELTLTCSTTDSIRITAVPLGDTTDYEAAVCQGEPYMDTIFTVSTTQTAEAGTYQFLVETGRNTCGIYIARLTLTVNPVYDAHFGYVEIEDVVCEGQPYQAHGFDLTADSILTLRAMHQTQVYGDIVLYNYDETEYACDSITQLTLHVLPKVYVDTTIHRCENLLPYLYTENGQEFSVEGDTTVNVLYQQVDNGCDSIRRVAIVFDPMPVRTVTGTEICANAETATLMLTYTNDNQVDADSIKWYINNDVVSTDDRLDLTLDDFNSSIAVEVYAGACVFTPNVTIELIENPEVDIDTTICEGVTYVAPDGREFTQTMENYECYVDDVNGGCQIHYVVNLTVNPTYEVPVSQTIRATDLPYVWNGVTFEAAGTQVVSLTASTGCDSTVTMTLQLTDTLGGEPFMVTEQIGDNEFSLTAFANRYNQNTKVAIAYSVYKDGNLVNNIDAECGGVLYMGTKWQNTYVGNEVSSAEGYIPGNTFRMGVNYFDYFYFHFLNGRDNKLTHTFTEPGDYEIVFTLMSREAGNDIYLTYTVNNETRIIGGDESTEGVQLAIHSLTFTVEGAGEDQQGDGTLPTLLVDNAATADVQSATSTVSMTYVGNGYDPDAMLAVNYVVYRDGEPLSSVANVGDIRFSTYYPMMNSYVGDALVQGSGNIFESTFNLMNMFRYNYFYLHFLQTTNSQLTATWNQPGEYQMVFTLVEMRNGNDVGLTYNGSQNAGGQNAVSTNTILSTATVNYHASSNNNGAPEVQTGIADSDADSQFDLYPNPARDIVHVQCAVADAQLTVTDMNGKVVYALDGTHNGTIEMNVSGWSAGVYFVNLRNNDTVVTKKLVVTR